MNEVFKFSEIEARRMRRGVFLFPLLVLPFAAVLGSDSGKSQPVHFLIVFGIGVIVSAVVVAITWAGVQAQIRSARSTKLIVSADRLTWSSTMGESALLFEEVIKVGASIRFGKVRFIVLHRTGKAPVRIEAYERMDELLESLRCRLPAELFR